LGGPEHITMYKIVFDTGNNVEMSSDHPLYERVKGWVSVDPNLSRVAYGDDIEKIEIGDYIMNVDCKYDRIIDIETISIPSTKTYTFSTKNTNSKNYYANGILSHNMPNSCFVTAVGPGSTEYIPP